VPGSWQGKSRLTIERGDGRDEFPASKIKEDRTAFAVSGLDAPGAIQTSH